MATHRVALLAAALLSASLFPSVAAEGCNALFHASSLISSCASAESRSNASRSDDCCSAVLATLAEGGARCLCLASRTHVAVVEGYTPRDFLDWYGDCAGSSDDYSEQISSCSSESDVGSPPPPSPLTPPSPPPPPSTTPPSLVVRVPASHPWWDGIIEWVMGLATFVIVVGSLFACSRWCKGPARDISSRALDRILNGSAAASGEQAQPSDAGALHPQAHVNGHVSVPVHGAELPTGRPLIDCEERRMYLLANHFAIKRIRADTVFYQYNVVIKSQDGNVVGGNVVSRRVMKTLHTFRNELSHRGFAYDGDKCIFTVGPLTENYLEVRVSLEEMSSRTVGGGQGKFYSVCISYAGKVPLAPLALALHGSESGDACVALTVLQTILRQRQARRGCLLINQSFFNSEAHDLVDLTGGVSVCYGFHSAFCPTVGGLTLSVDVSTTMVVTPGSVIDFICASQSITDIKQVNWPKAKKMLENLRVITKHNKLEFRILGLSDQPCSKQIFEMKTQPGKTKPITVQDYFRLKQIELLMPDLYCLDVGNLEHPCYLPLELCDMVSLQRYTKALSSQQRAAFVEKSRLEPGGRMRLITNAMNAEMYDGDPLLCSCGIEIEKQPTRVAGRVLSAPTLVVGKGEECVPNEGRWSYDNKFLLEPVKIEHWAIVNFSTGVDMNWIAQELINFGQRKGIIIKPPHTMLEEDSKARKFSPVERVQKMYKKVVQKFTNPPEFLLCVLPEKKNCDIYGPWKKKALFEIGVATQCIAPGTKMNDHYFTNVLLKINSKLGGLNFKLAFKQDHMIPAITTIPTLIIGMDVSHGAPGRTDDPSVSAVVGSRCWPLVSRYRASVRTQPPKVELINSLFTPLCNGRDEGMISELLLDFYETSQQRKPSQIVIFRDGVSESQFTQVLNIELNQIIKACDYMWDYRPKFTVIIAQKNHHTRLVQAESTENVPPGTVVDSIVVNPKHHNFFMFSQPGTIGISRPTHYHVLLDEIGFSADNLQKLVLSLSYVNQRSTCGDSVVAPIRYAHLAAAQMSQLIKSEEFAGSESPAGSGASSASASATRHQPSLHPKVSSSMFFC